ncbi:MAG: M20 family metallo-hydrolase [Pseudomonadota bacterium]
MSREVSCPIQPERLLDDLEALSHFGRLPEGGLDRPAYSPAYREAIDWLAGRFETAGLAVRMDPAGNLIGRLGPAEGPAVLSGSHVDAVPSGGFYDGALGVLAALECARTLAERGGVPRPLEIVAFADEEGAFLGLTGSRAMVGQVEQEEVASAVGRDGQPFTEALARFGLEPTAFLKAARPPQDFAGYLELHIEQGPVLESRGLEVGVVESIVGIANAELIFRGEQAHAGTTPLALRRDALRAAAETLAESTTLVERDFPPDMRLTYGALAVAPGAANVVPAEARLGQEIRGPDLKGMEALFGRAEAIARARADANRVALEIVRGATEHPAVMAPALTARIEAACQALGCGHTRMPSGAGHDAQILAQVTPAAMIFVPSRAGLSHNPAEATDPRHIALGARVLYLTLAGMLGA